MSSTLERPRLSPEDRRANERAVRAFVSISGGFEGLLFNGTTFEHLAQILYADPADDLSGLRLMAERMEFGVDRAKSTEPVLTPDMAKFWLLRRGAREADEGLVLEGDPNNPNHLDIAALAIFNSGEPRALSDAYEEVTTSISPISPEIIVDLGHMIVGEYERQTEDRP
jgi:hypothetical protein